MMGLIFAVIICIIFPIGFGEMLLYITTKIKSSFDKFIGIKELGVKIKHIEEKASEL